MSELDELLKAYEPFVRLPWSQNLSGPERVWFAVYEPMQERRLRLRLGEFENITKKYNHNWLSVDLTTSFGEWMGQHKYRKSYFEEPNLINSSLEQYSNGIVAKIKEILKSPNVDSNTVVAVTGVASLFGLTKVSAVVGKVVDDIPGRLLVFFPGQQEGSTYRLLDARDGWDYLAIPITTKKWGVD